MESILGRALIERNLHGESIISFEKTMRIVISNVLGNLEHFFPKDLFLGRHFP